MLNLENQNVEQENEELFIGQLSRNSPLIQHFLIMYSTVVNLWPNISLLLKPRLRFKMLELKKNQILNLNKLSIETLETKC